VREARTILAVLVLVGTTAGCGSSAPAAAPATGGGAKPVAAPAATSATTVNLEEIFPPGNGRDLVLDNCQNCHTFVPIVVLQKDKESWRHWASEHRQKVPNLSDAQFTTLSEYLTANFGPHRPVPPLPKELLDSWTTY
jgi:mono/diheme cytochrome c family protein